MDKALRHGTDGWGMWHFAFYASPVAEFLVQGHEDTYLRWFFRNMAYSAFYESGQQNQAAAVEKRKLYVWSC
jgi:hypothetical protein